MQLFVRKSLDHSFKSLDLASLITKLIISNDEMNDIMKIVQSLKESDLLIKDVRETIRNEAKEEKARFSSML